MCKLPLPSGKESRLTFVPYPQTRNLQRMNCHSLVVLTSAFLISGTGVAQNEVALHIHHLMSGQPLELGVSYAVQGTEAQINRLEYYLCDFVVTHDGGQETALNDVYVLANAQNDGAYSLGLWDVESIESISFGVGVDAGHNVGIDPSTYPTGHPLAPQFPSMHWGWASGYRFLALEGFGGDNLIAEHQIHALGDNNFFHQNHDLTAEASEGVVNLYLNANCEQLFTNLPLSQGFIEHSNTGEATEAMENMRDLVFEAGEPLHVSEWHGDVSLTLYPNPTMDELRLDARGLTGAEQWSVSNAFGQALKQGMLTPNTVLAVSDLPRGWYVVAVLNRQGHLVAERPFVKQ